MTYEEWKKCEQLPQPYPLYNAATVRKLVERIDNLEQRVIDSRTRTNDLERWVKGIADDKQMPTYVQQSARSLLALEGELSMTLPKGYAIVPIEPTDSMIEAGLGADSNAFPLKYMYQAMIEAAQEGE
jgi:hypothetical protein